jgi:hypothetical protein
MRRFAAATAALTAALVIVAVPAGANGQPERTGAGAAASVAGPRGVELRYCTRC